MTDTTTEIPLSLKDLGRQLGKSQRTLIRWRLLGMPHHRLGKRVYYFAGEVVGWVKSHTRDPGSVNTSG